MEFRGPIIVMGVSGSGKTTVGTLLAKRLDVLYVEGDKLHPEANIYKMGSGIALNDDDRRPWLEAVGKTLAQLANGDTLVVAACSALKKSYRDILRSRTGEGTLFVYLEGSHELIVRRMEGRQGHFFPNKLLDSQFAALEPPDDSEIHITVDAQLEPDALVDSIVEQVSALQSAN